MSTAGHSQLLLDSLAGVLADLAAEIECLGEALCSDPQVVGQHMAQLQGLDLAAQCSRTLADILQSRQPEVALANVGLEALRERLQAYAVPAQDMPLHDAAR